MRSLLTLALLTFPCALAASITLTVTAPPGTTLTYAKTRTATFDVTRVEVRPHAGTQLDPAEVSRIKRDIEGAIKSQLARVPFFGGKTTTTFGLKVLAPGARGPRFDVAVGAKIGDPDALTLTQSVLPDGTFQYANKTLPDNVFRQLVGSLDGNDLLTGLPSVFGRPLEVGTTWQTDNSIGVGAAAALVGGSGDGVTGTAEVISNTTYQGQDTDSNDLFDTKTTVALKDSRLEQSAVRAAVDMRITSSNLDSHTAYCPDGLLSSYTSDQNAAFEYFVPDEDYDIVVTGQIHIVEEAALAGDKAKQ